MNKIFALFLLLFATSVYAQTAAVTNPPNVSGNCSAWSNATNLLGNSGLACKDGSVRGTYLSPAWATYNTIFDGSRLDLGGFPLANEFGGNTVGIVQSLVGTLSIPSTSTAGNAGNGVAGYAITASPNQGAVGTFGFGGTNVNGGSAWGGNFLVQNCPIAAACPTNTGFTNDVLFGVEINTNILKSGGVAPNTPTRGIYIIGGSEVVPNSPTFYGIDIDSPGISQTPHLKWLADLALDDGSATAGIQVGTTDVGNNVGSMPITLNSRTSGGVTKTASVQSTPSGDIVLSGNAGSAATLSSPGGCSLSALPSSISTSCPFAIKGTTTNDNAAAGYVGEYICARVENGGSPTGCATNSATPVTLTSNTAANVTSISLTAGDWEVCGDVVMLDGNSTTASLEIGWISSASASVPTNDSNRGSLFQQFSSVGPSGAIASPVGCQRQSLASTTTIYLGAYQTFVGSNASAYGFISARRVR